MRVILRGLALPPSSVDIARLLLTSSGCRTTGDLCAEGEVRLGCSFVRATPA